MFLVSIPSTKARQSPNWRGYLNLETSGGTTTTSSLKLATLGLDIGFLVLVGSKAKVLDGLSGVLWSSQQESVTSSRSTLSQLIQSQGLTTGGNDAGTGGSGEAESGNAELGDGQETVVIGDGTNDDNGLIVGLLGGVGNNAREGDGWAVDARHEEAAEHDFVEGRLGTTSQESVQLHQELKIDIVTLRRLAMSVAYVMCVQVDTHCCGWR